MTAGRQIIGALSGGEQYLPNPLISRCSQSQFPRQSLITEPPTGGLGWGWGGVGGLRWCCVGGEGVWKGGLNHPLLWPGHTNPHPHFFTTTTTTTPPPRPPPHFSTTTITTSAPPRPHPTSRVHSQRPSSPFLSHLPVRSPSYNPLPHPLPLPSPGHPRLWIFLSS